MLHRFHDRFGTAGLVVAVIALVLALTGAAIAAGGLTKSQEKRVIKIAKKYAGKPGANGTNGTNGAEGKEGKEGAKGEPGTNGKDGSNGESVTAGAFPGAVGICTEGGSEFTVGTGAPTFACNGKKGTNGTNGTNGKSIITETESAGANCKEGGASFHQEGPGTKTYACKGEPWTAGGTLPSGQSETGQWGVAFNAAQAVGLDSISFTIPLKTAPVGALFVEEGNTTNPFCKGTLAAPTAEAGYLCVYLGEPSMNGGTPPEPNVEGLTILDAGTKTSGVGTTGAIAAFLGKGTSSELAFWMGTWAVTAAP